MGKMSYMNCMYCDKFFGFIPTAVSPDGTTSVKCPQCSKVIVYRVVSPNQSTPSNSRNESKPFVADVDDVPVADTIATEFESQGAEEIK